MYAVTDNSTSSISSNNRARSVVAVLLLGWGLLSVSAAQATEVYKWIDANGIPSYGERPPAGVSYTKLKLNGTRTTPSRGLPPPFPVPLKSQSNGKPGSKDKPASNDKLATKVEIQAEAKQKSVE